MVVHMLSEKKATTLWKLFQLFEDCVESLNFSTHILHLTNTAKYSFSDAGILYICSYRHMLTGKTEKEIKWQDLNWFIKE